MTTRRTPHGELIPDNFNSNGYIPGAGSLDYNDPDLIEVLASPHLVERVNEAIRQGYVTHAQGIELMTDLRQFRRALNGERALPGEYLGRDDLPHQPMPYAVEEEHLPGREPGTPLHDTLRAAVERMDADRITSTLIQQMDENAPQASTWERADPNYGARAAASASSDDAPPSLRESIQASVDALSPSN